MSLPLTLSRLEEAVAGGVAAIRSRTRLQPAGGPGDKLFPPTYATGDRTLKYAVEKRRIDGEDVTCIVLDAVQSQANRMEEALYGSWEDDGLPFPVIAVDFSAAPDLADLHEISTLHVPHRVYDALLRDSMADGVLFRDTDLGKAITFASERNATPMFRACPTALLLGAWDSTGPRGGMGTKFPRMLVSEIIAVRAVPGVKTTSRLDPAGIQANVPVYHLATDPDDYTINSEEAQRDEKGNPKPFSRKGSEGKGKPSSINHSNVAPSVDIFAGGITCDRALQTTVLSLAGLRRLRFPANADGELLPPERRGKAESAARTTLAALSLVAMALHREMGFDLRSRCALVPESPFLLELVDADGGPSENYSLSADEARALLGDAHARSREVGMGWTREPIRLTPAPKLVDLIRRSRSVAAAGGKEQGGE